VRWHASCNSARRVSPRSKCVKRLSGEDITTLNIMVINKLRWINLFAVAFALVQSYPAMARVDVKVGFDKNFNFGAVKTWGWNPNGAGEVKMARTKEDDPEAWRRRAEPIVVEAVTTEMNRRGLTAAPPNPDLTVTYYLLLTTGVSSQTMGQFLPATTAWGLPPFEARTQSVDMMNRGSLVLDLSSKGTVVWRGVAQAKIDFDVSDQKREALLREAVRDLLKKYPSKK
jgi:uncharacterized protein DUF4136